MATIMDYQEMTDAINNDTQIVSNNQTIGQIFKRNNINWTGIARNKFSPLVEYNSQCATSPASMKSRIYYLDFNDWHDIVTYIFTNLQSGFNTFYYQKLLTMFINFPFIQNAYVSTFYNGANTTPDIIGARFAPNPITFPIAYGSSITNGVAYATSTYIGANFAGQIVTAKIADTVGNIANSTEGTVGADGYVTFNFGGAAYVGGNTYFIQITNIATPIINASVYGSIVKANIFYNNVAGRADGSVNFYDNITSLVAG